MKIRQFLANEDGFLGAILGSVASGLTNKLLGGGESKSGTNLVQLKNQADATGVNFLTALNATGGGNFNSSTPPLASAELIGGSVKDAFTPKTEAEKQRDENLELQNDLLKIEIDRTKSGTTTAQNYTPTPTNPTTQTTAKDQTSGVFPTGISGSGRRFTFDTVGNLRTPALTAGVPWETAENFSDAEICEQRYGDIAQEICGVVNLGADIKHNLPKIGASVGGKVQNFLDDQEARQAAYEEKQKVIRLNNYRPRTMPKLTGGAMIQAPDPFRFF